MKLQALASTVLLTSCLAIGAPSQVDWSSFAPPVRDPTTDPPLDFPRLETMLWDTHRDTEPRWGLSVQRSQLGLWDLGGADVSSLRSWVGDDMTANRALGDPRTLPESDALVPRQPSLDSLTPTPFLVPLPAAALPGALVLAGVLVGVSTQRRRRARV